MNQSWRIIGPLTLLGLSASHAAGASAPGFADVRRIVQARTGATVNWESQARGEGLSADSLQALLQVELTADRAVQIALLNNRSLQARFGEIGVSQADLRQAALPRNPALEGEIRSGSSGHHPGELIVMQDLSSILLLPLRKRATSLTLRRTTLQAAKAALDLVADTRSAFYSLQAAQQVRDLWSTTAGAAQVAADLARRQREAGNITSLDLENQQAVYEEAKIQLARIDVEVIAARERLNQLMGTWGKQTTWQVASAIPAFPDSERSLEGLESAAVAQRLDLAGVEAEVQAAEQALPLARFSQFPDLRVGVHFESEPEGTRTTGPAVELAFPLFDRGQAAVDRAKAQLRQAQDRQAALAVEIRSQVRAARDRLTTTHQLLKYYRNVVLPRRKRIVEQTQLEFNGMLVGVYQLLQAKQNQVTAEREYLEAQRDYWIARTELERELGGPLPTSSER